MSVVWIFVILLWLDSGKTEEKNVYKAQKTDIIYFRYVHVTMFRRLFYCGVRDAKYLFIEGTHKTKSQKTFWNVFLKLTIKNINTYIHTHSYNS